MSAKLIISNTDTARSREFELTADETRLGRSVDLNDVVLEDAQVSRQHAMIRRSGQNFTLIDPGSANGTFINGEWVTQHLLKNGDVFVIGKYTLQFSHQVAPAISIRYEEKKIGNTVLLRAPSELGAI